jgi:hypothetical protein
LPLNFRPVFGKAPLHFHIQQVDSVSAEPVDRSQNPTSS